MTTIQTQKSNVTTMPSTSVAVNRFMYPLISIFIYTIIHSLQINLRADLFFFGSWTFFEQCFVSGRTGPVFDGILDPDPDPGSLKNNKILRWTKIISNHKRGVVGSVNYLHMEPPRLQLSPEFKEKKSTILTNVL